MSDELEQMEPEETIDELETAAEEAKAEVENETEPEVEEEPEKVEYVRPVRQWITLHTGSLDQRVGLDIIEKIGKDAKSLSGLPRLALVVRSQSASAEIIEELRRTLVSSGFKVEYAEIADGPDNCTLAESIMLMAQLAEHGISGDDVVLAVGDASVLSVASYVCNSWFEKTVLIQVPTDLEAALVAGVTPYALDMPGAAKAIQLDSSCRMSVTDFRYVEVDGNSEPVLMARALMAQGAILESEHTFAHLYDRAEKIAEGIREAVSQQIAESVRTRGRTIASASVAVRQSINYGDIIATAFKNLVPHAAPSTCLAEALRFSARYGVTESAFPLDDMIAQDEMLEGLELGSLSVDLDPQDLHDAIKAECLRRSNRFMMLIPQSLGRVRIMNIDSDRLLDHCNAWCAAHAADNA